MPAGYFVTVCTVDREPLFGTVVGGAVQVNRFGEIVREEWFRTAQLRRNVLLLEEEFVVMPNHVHGIVWLTEDPPADASPSEQAVPRLPAGSLGAVVGAFKAAAARRINRERGTPGAPVWQRNFWERIVRSDRELERIRQYIVENPLRWQEDSLHPGRWTPSEALDFLVVPSEDGPSTS
ncbi:transposase [Thermomicrobium sp. 4228-Ro]|uniref:transposase n=1 Tax=Thermomicrobium sp. 4228-Ro TaxID=2993937 RepID=UPI003A4C80C2